MIGLAIVITLKMLPARIIAEVKIVQTLVLLVLKL
jgi:hypothetical protein